MAFWGALVRTDEPFSVVLDGGPHRRLHVSQAALGESRGRKTEHSQRRNRLYCKVGENPRILLCALRFNGTEMCSLHHEFTAPDDVVFSVVGVRDIHISGYYFNEFRLPYTIRPQNIIAPLPSREEVETSGDTFVLDAPMQHVGETGRPAEESALHDGGDQHSNLVENRRSRTNDCLGIVTQASGQSLMNVRASGSREPILASGWKEVQNLPELLMHICYCLLTKAPHVMKWADMALSSRGKEVQEMLQVHFPMLGCIECGVKLPRLGHRCTSDDEVYPFGNLVQENSSSRPAEQSALHDGADQHINLVEENRSPIVNECLGIMTLALQQLLMNSRAAGRRQHGVKSPRLLVGEPRLGERWSSDNEVNPFGNLVQENRSSRIMKKITLFELEQPSKVIENETERPAEESALHDGADQHINLVEDNRSPRFVQKCTSDDKVNRLANLVQGNSSSRHVEKITFYELEPLGNIIEENESESLRNRGTREGELTKPDEMLNNIDDLRGNSGRLVNKQKIKPKKKKTTSKGLSACEDDFNAVHLESVHHEKAKDRDNSQLVNEDRLKPEKKKRKTDGNSMSVGLTSIRKEASEPNQQNSAVKPRKVVDCSKEQGHIKKDEAAKWIFKRRGVDEENLQLQADECETTMVDYHSGKQPQLKANKKRKPKTICDQDLCNQRSQLDDRNSTHHIANERDKGKLRSGFVIDEEKLETCDASDAGEIKKKKSKTEQVIVPAADTRQEHVWRVSVEPAATPLTSTGTENSWTVVAALPAFGNPQIQSTVVICKGTLEMPPTVSSSSDAHDKGESKKKGKEKLKTQQVQVPIVETNNENSRSHSVESVEVPLTSASVGNMMQKIIPGLFIQKESKKKGKRKRKTQKMEVPIVETNDERSHSVESVETLLTSASVGNMIEKIISALLIHGHSELKHGFVGSEGTPEVPSSGVCQSHACDPGEVEKKKKKKIQKKIPKSKWSHINESVRRRLFGAQGNSDNNRRITSLSTDGHPKSKHDFVEPEETVELPSDLNDSGEIKKKKKMKGKKKIENIGDSGVDTNDENVRSAA